MRRTELSRASDRRRGAAERAGSTFTEPSGGLQRRGRIRPFSRKRARAMRERRDLVTALWEDRPQCARLGCTRLSDDVHEILPRARGGSITDARIFAPLCRQDHDEATNEAQWAYDEGLLFHSWDAAEARGEEVA